MSTLAQRSRAGWGDVVTHRYLVGAISALFILPNVLFAAQLQPVAAEILLAGGFAGLVLILRTRDAAGEDWLGQPVAAGRLAALVALSLVIFLLGGEGHLFYANPDWLIRDAVLADLVRTDGLPVYTLGGSDYLLRAPVGMYLLPALVGRSLGLHAAHGALLCQNALLLGAILYVLTADRRSAARLSILLLFAGICILPRIAAVLSLGRDLSDLARTARPLDEWNTSLQYSSSITQFFWVPNHALPGWWLAALAILCRRGRADLPVLLVTTGALAIWSPLAILAGVPLGLYLAARRGWGVVLDGRAWGASVAGACFLPVAIYLVLGGGDIAHSVPGSDPDFLPLLGLFLVVQLPAAAYVLARWERLPTELRGLFAISLAILLLLPFVSFGPGNDLVMRGSIPPLVIVAFYFSEVVLRSPDDRPDWRRIALALILLGSLSAAVEVARAITAPSFDISDCTLIEATAALDNHEVPTNYVAPVRLVPSWLRMPSETRLRGDTSRLCWPDLRRPDRL